MSRRRKKAAPGYNARKSAAIKNITVEMRRRAVSDPWRLSTMKTSASLIARRTLPNINSRSFESARRTFAAVALEVFGTGGTGFMSLL